MLLETISHAIALDLGWFVGLVMNNLFWVMVFALAGFFLRSGKKILVGGIFMTLFVYATVDVVNLLGWSFNNGIVWTPVMVIVGLMIYDAFFEKKSWHLAKRAMVTSIIFYLGLIFVNVLM